MSSVRQPLLGILVPSRQLSASELRKGAERYLRTHRKAHGTVIAFSASGIDWRRGRVAGYRYVPAGGGRGRWQRGHYPIPRAVYRDMIKRGKVARKLYRWTGGRLFNLVLTSSKFIANAVMSSSPELRPHIPDTRRFSRSALHDLLSQYGTVYVKPDKGMQGRGIYRVQRRRTNCVISHARDSWTVPEGELYTHLRPRLRREQYIVQQAIDLARYRGRPFDVRVMVQCGNSLNWKCTGYMAKVAGRRQVVTNLERGHNRMISAERALRDAGLPAAEVIARMRALAKQAARALNGRVGAYASLGFDMAVDRRGHVWIIEANPRPSHALAGGGTHSVAYGRANAAVYSHLRYLATHRVADLLPETPPLPKEQLHSAEDRAGATGAADTGPAPPGGIIPGGHHVAAAPRAAGTLSLGLASF